MGQEAKEILVMKFIVLTIRKHVRRGERRSSTSVSRAWLAIVLVSLIEYDIVAEHVINSRYPITATKLAFECRVLLTTSRVRISSLLSVARVVVKLVAYLLKHITHPFMSMPACCRSRSTLVLLLIRQEAGPDLFEGNARRGTLILLTRASQVSLTPLNGL